MGRLQRPFEALGSGDEQHTHPIKSANRNNGCEFGREVGWCQDSHGEASLSPAIGPTVPDDDPTTDSMHKPAGERKWAEGNAKADDEHMVISHGIVARPSLSIVEAAHWRTEAS